MPYIVIDETRCKGCGLCTIACPHRLIELGDKLNIQGYAMVIFSNEERCSGCALCAKICPDVAIAVFK